MTQPNRKPAIEKPVFDQPVDKYYYLEGVASSLGPDREGTRYSVEFLNLLAKSLLTEFPTVTFNHGHNYTEEYTFGLIVDTKVVKGKCWVLIRLEDSRSVQTLIKKINFGHKFGLSIEGRPPFVHHHENGRAVLDSAQFGNLTICVTPSNPDCTFKLLEPKYRQVELPCEICRYEKRIRETN